MIMFDFDMFPDIGEGIFPLPENGNCPFCEDNGNGGESGNGKPHHGPDWEVPSVRAFIREQKAPVRRRG